MGLADGYLRCAETLAESYGIQAVSIVLVEAMRIPTAPDGAIRRDACRCQFLDGDIGPLAQWRVDGPGAKPREANVVELTAGARARGQRVSRS